MLFGQRDVRVERRTPPEAVAASVAIEAKHVRKDMQALGVADADKLVDSEGRLTMAGRGDTQFELEHKRRVLGVQANIYWGLMDGPAETENIDCSQLQTLLKSNPPDTAYDLNVSADRWAAIEYLVNQKRMSESQRTAGEQWERTAFVMLNKYLGNDFLVVRTNAYDDFGLANSNSSVQKKESLATDMLVIHKATGLPFALYVEAISHVDAEHRRRGRVKAAYDGGGLKIEFGLVPKNEAGKKAWEPGKMNHVPALYLRVKPEDLDVLAAGVAARNSQGPSLREASIMKELVTSLSEQANKMRMRVTRDDATPAAQAHLSETAVRLHAVLDQAAKKIGS